MTSAVSIGRENVQTEPNTHFLKGVRRDPMQLYKQPVKVDLEDDLRGKVERFDVRKNKHSPKRREHGSDSKGREQQAQKYSHYVNEINRKSSSRSPVRTPKSRFDAEAYKKKFQR